MTLGGARRGYVKQGYTARDYVQNGLIEMYDSIENGGFGISDKTSKTWVPCVGTKTISLSDSEYVSDDDTIVLTSSKTAANHYDDIPNPVAGDITIEGAVVTANVSWQTQSFMMLQQHNYAINGFQLFWNSNNAVKNRFGFAQNYNDTSVNFYTYPFSAGEKATATVVFHRQSRLMDIYVKAEKKSTIEIPENIVVFDDNGTRWNRTLLNLHCSVGGAEEIKIGNARWYSRALTAAEIATNYAVDKARFKIPD